MLPGITSVAKVHNNNLLFACRSEVIFSSLHYFISRSLLLGHVPARQSGGVGKLIDHNIGQPRVIF